MTGLGRPLLLRNGWVYRSASDPPLAGSLLVDGGRIRALGTDRDVAESAPSGCLEIDLGNRTVLPGLIDAHLHFEQYALSFDLIDCEVPSLEECVARVREGALDLDIGEWVRGHGWNDNAWSRSGTRQDLDAASGGRPAFLTAKSLHAGWANSEALRLAGVTAETPDPPDGHIVRQPDGSPSGILLEGAGRLVSACIAPPSPELLASKMQAAQENLWRMGLTGIHDFDGARCLQGLQLLREGGRLGLRVLKNIPYADLNAAIQVGLRSGFGDEWIRLGHAKVFADGALGPRTAAMLEAYDDAPGNLGIGFLDAEELLERALRAGEHGWGMAIHAIGDRANHIVLDALAALREQEQLRGWVRRRHRIEHLQLLHPADIPRPAALGVVASMQPLHATSDMEMADRGWGARVRSAYAWRSQLSAGAILAFGSDAPVESPNPFWGLHAAITRRRSDGSPGLAGWVPQEKLGLSEALAGYTRGAALAAGWEESAGFLGPGSWADLIVLDDDPFRIEPDAVRDLSPVGVMTDGEFRLRKF
jgi:predicted amidohydrolase YtcJ